ncbi:MAG: hypothetical protein WA874_14605 [Chryseosolibacter sp.]
MGEAGVFQWLEATPLSVYIRQSRLLYPVIEIIHITGIVFLAGSAFLFDFRLLGISRKISVRDLAQHLLPWSRRSLFLLVIPSGLLLFITEATAYSANSVFGLKLILILLALANAGYFHLNTFQTVATWDDHKSTPGAAKAAGIISLVLWTSVITCGRLLAYFE